MPIFDLMQKTGDINRMSMYNTFNMGIGMVLALDPADADAAKKAAEEAGVAAFVIGEATAGEKGVTLC